MLNNNLRSGTWSPEEIAYATALGEAFHSGLLDMQDNSISLRKLLSRKLKTSPKRISKKFEGTNYAGKVLYVRKADSTEEEIARTTKRLRILEQRFWESVQAMKEAEEDVSGRQIPRLAGTASPSLGQAASNLHQNIRVDLLAPTGSAMHRTMATMPPALFQALSQRTPSSVTHPASGHVIRSLVSPREAVFPASNIAAFAVRPTLTGSMISSANAAAMRELLNGASAPGLFSNRSLASLQANPNLHVLREWMATRDTLGRDNAWPSHHHGMIQRPSSSSVAPGTTIVRPAFWLQGSHTVARMQQSSTSAAAPQNEPGSHYSTGSPPMSACTVTMQKEGLFHHSATTKGGTSSSVSETGYQKKRLLDGSMKGMQTLSKNKKAKVLS